MNSSLQFWLGVSESPAMMLLKGFVSSHHKVTSPTLLPVQISEAVSQGPGGISVVPGTVSRTVAKPSYLRLRGGGAVHLLRANAAASCLLECSRAS